MVMEKSPLDIVRLIKKMLRDTTNVKCNSEQAVVEAERKL
jgi:hypothetical protein